MAIRRRSLLFPLLASLALPVTGSAAEDDPVTIYRCTDESGHLTVQNSPCPEGDTQRMTEMLRPTDAPPSAIIQPAPTPTPPPSSPRPPPTVVRTVATTYECTTPDGGTYTSHDPGGNPRWVPSWHWSRPGLLPPHRPPTRPPQRLPPARMTSTMPARGDAATPFTARSYRSAPAPSRGEPLRWPRQPVHGVLVPSGEWVRDTCVPLPQAEVCERLHDRRWALGRDYNSALQSERRRIDAEQRGIDARLAEECR